MLSLRELSELVSEPASHPVQDVTGVLYRSKKLTFFGSWHTNNPKDPLYLKLKSAFDDYLKGIMEGKGVVITESSYGSKIKVKGTFEGSVELYYDSGAAVFLAKASNIEVVSGEYPTELISDELVEHGFDRNHVAFYEMLVMLPPNETKDYQTVEANQLHFIIRASKADLLVPFSEEEINTINNFDLVSERRKIIWSHCLKNINKLSEGLIGEKFFDEETGYKLMSTQKIESFCYPPDKNGSLLNRIAYYYLHFRDLYLLETIVNEVNKGKVPFVVFGQNHLVRLKPALEKM